MDYGQPTNQDDRSNPFFTTGAGTNRETVNTFQSENNLDLSNNQADWSAPLERDHRSIGNKAMGAPETSPDQENVNSEVPDLTNMGKVISLDASRRDYNPKENPSTAEVAEQAISFDRKKIKTGETLEEAGVQEVQNVINKLNQDGNVADFYDTARDMMEANLYNSYKRKLAA
ncbi:hypothetical protein J6S37_01905 [Candidatus Saccharibacteria bacterium]|nr:hypothetical protein [Candidatus Saccharibacteria bacterium]